MQVPCFQGWKKQHLLDPVKCWGVTGFIAAQGCPVSEDGRLLSHGAHILKARCSRPSPRGWEGTAKTGAQQGGRDTDPLHDLPGDHGCAPPRKAYRSHQTCPCPLPRTGRHRAPAAHAACSALWDPCSCLTAVVGTLPEGRPVFAGRVTCEDLV